MAARLIRDPRTGFLLLDTFYERLTELTAQGWVVLNVSRYDPTHMDGLTPGGRAFTLDMAGDTITLIIAGRTRSLTRAKALWEDGDAAVQALADAYASFPAGQR